MAGMKLTLTAQPTWLKKRFAPDLHHRVACEAAKSRPARGMLGAVIRGS